jgi:hypothetical protein
MGFQSQREQKGLSLKEEVGQMFSNRPTTSNNSRRYRGSVSVDLGERSVEKLTWHLPSFN